MSDLVRFTTHGDVAVIAVDNPPVNALSPGVPEGILAALEKARADEAVRAVILMGAGATFIAGADIKEFGKVTSGQTTRTSPLPGLIRALEDFPKPVASAIHGNALGGGLEVAMGCHYRVAVPSARIGQPEVKLGLIPGAGGTQRLPRLAGVAKAIEMCVQGDPITAADALQHGIVDRVIEGDLVEGAAAFLREKVAAGGPHPRTRDLSARLGDAAANAPVFAAARDAARKKARGLLAPARAIDAIEAAVAQPFDQGLAREAELFRECLFSDQSKALIHVFFAERAVSRIPGIPKDAAGAPVRRAAVLGAGTMGSGIAMVYANAGIPVTLGEADAEALERGMAAIRKNYAGSVERGKLTRERAEERLALIRPVVGMEGFGEADIVVEAVFEGMALKKQVFARLDEVCGPHVILATNTSSLSIDEIAAATARPQRVIGHHFFAPPHVMRLLEIVRGRATAPEVIAASLALARKLGKVGVLVGNCRGFVGNRMYAQYQREAQYLVEEGASVPQVDAALQEFGMAMGPLATGDLSGLDVGWRIRKEFQHLDPPGLRPLLADHLCELGRYGQKTGGGWYRYEPGNHTPLPDPEVDRIVAERARQSGIRRREVPAAEIVDRTVFALVNEGAKILEEGIALRAGDIDIVYVYGYGFPAHRGGPMWYADTVGLPHVYERVQQFAHERGPLWTPAPLLRRLAEEGRKLADLDNP
ncbi:MAG TPA: 3-hydroxyacyl-CoA dehydrogenase NAD-binding domain-containing protein [Vicinamibacteria bacterium]|nr:3-hydroxyacyl-CoA dehydrogenase NAD-binding domain-containing protein [Vicinamibacteria bacterium]